MIRTVVVLFVIVWSSVAIGSERDVTLEDARDLYYKAAYEEALGALDRVTIERVADAVARERYRAACLFALGRLREAEGAFEAIVSLAPDLLPDDLGLSPSVTAAFAVVRARLVSDLERKELSETPDANPVLQPRPDYTVNDTNVHPPMTLDQRVPAPPVMKGVDFSGTAVLEVAISSSGAVDSVVLQKGIHPVYDAMIQHAASGWKYSPATLDGRPVPFRKLLRIDVR